MSVTVWLPAYTKISLKLSSSAVTPFYKQNTNSSILKCSPQLQLQLQLGFNPSQRDIFTRCYCKMKERETPFSSPLRQEDDSPWESGGVWSNLALYLFTLHIPLSFGGLSVVALLTGRQPLHPQTQVTSPLSFLFIVEFCCLDVQITFCFKYSSNSLTRIFITLSKCIYAFIAIIVLLNLVTMLLVNQLVNTKNKFSNCFVTL